MTKEIIFVAQGGFNFVAKRICCEVGDLPQLDVAQPINGTPNVDLNIDPIFLKEAGGQRELLNAETVAHALKKLPEVGSFIAYEVFEDDLPPVAEKFLRLMYRYLKPCYEMPTKKEETSTCRQDAKEDKKTTAARRQDVLNILKNDTLLQQFITETVFPGKNPLQRSTLYKLYDGQLSVNILDKDLKVFRDNQQEPAEQTSTRSEASPATKPKASPAKKPTPAPATEPMQAEVSGPAAPIAPDITATRLAADGYSAPSSAQPVPTTQDAPPPHRHSTVPVSEDAQPDPDAARHLDSRVDDRVEDDTVSVQMPTPSPELSAPPTQAPLENNAASTPSHPAPDATHQSDKAKPMFPQNLSQTTGHEHALRMAEFDFGVSPRTRHVGRTPQTVIREKLGLNID